MSETTHTTHADLPSQARKRDILCITRLPNPHREEENTSPKRQIAHKLAASRRRNPRVGQRAEDRILTALAVAVAVAADRKKWQGT